jgi:acyl dehydratase
MAINSSGLHFEDFAPGRTFTTGRRTVCEADHVNFTTSFGFFEPLFMDRNFVARETPYGKPIVPGALTFSVAEGLTILSGILHGTGMAFLGVELEVVKPVFFDDTLRVEIEVLDRRETKKADRGIVTFSHRVINQNDETVMEYTIRRMMRRKDG